MQLDTSRLSPPKPAEAPVNAGPEPVASEAEANPSLSLAADQIDELKAKLVAALCTCFDPEIPVNIYELGLIYSIDIAPTGAVGVRMTLTSPGCPVAGSLPGDVEHKLRSVPGVTAAKVEVVWEPPWDKSRMSEAAKLQLGIDD